MLLRHGRGLGVGVEVSLRHEMLQPDEVSVLEELQLVLGYLLLVVGLDHELVVLVLVRVSGYLKRFLEF